MIININKDNLVANPYITDANIELEITNAQGQQLIFTPNGYAGKYVEETDSFTLVMLTSPDVLRSRRQIECFNLVDNKSVLGWVSLSEAQKKEAQNGYTAWLNVTDTKIIPTKPEGLN